MGSNVHGAEALLFTLLSALAVLRPTLTRPGFANLRVLFAGWLQTTGLHAVTESLVVTGVIDVNYSCRSATIILAGQSQGLCS